MKTTKKMILSTLALIALLFIIRVPSNAAGSVQMTKFTDNTITVAWSAPSLYSGYTLNSYSIYDTTTNTYLATDISPNQTSYTMKVSGKGYIGRWRIDYIYTSRYGASYTYTGYGYTYVNTVPATYSKNKFGVSSLLSYTKKVSFAVQKYSSDSYLGTELEIRKVSNGKKVKTIKIRSSISDYIPFSSNVAYKYRVRAYYSNPSTQKTYYGGWSTYRYYAAPTFSGKYSAAKKEIKLTGIKKGSGIAKYKIQISTNKTSGFKTVKTIKIGKKKTYSCRISKYKKKKLKKNKTYYIRITPVIKGNKKSDTYGTASLTFYR